MLSIAVLIGLVVAGLCVVGGAAVGILFGLGILGSSSSSSVTPSPTASASRGPAPTTQGGVTVTLTVPRTSTTPTPVVPPTITQNSTASITQNSNDSYPNSGAVVFPSAFPNTVSGVTPNPGSATSKLMGYTCADPTVSGLTLTGFNAAIATCNNTTTPVVGYSLSATMISILGGQAQQNAIVTVSATGSNFPAVLYRSGNTTFATQIATNSAGTAWSTANSFSPGGSAGFYTGCAMSVDNSGNPVCIVTGSGASIDYFKLNSSNSVTTSYSLNGPSTYAFYTPLQMIKLSNGGYLVSISANGTDGSTGGLSCYTTATDSPANNGEWTLFNITTVLTPSSIGLVNGTPCYVGKSTNNILFAFATTAAPTSTSNFNTAVTAVASTLNRIPAGSYNIQVLPITVSSVVTPCIVWITTGNILCYVIASNAAGSTWPTSVNDIDTSCSNFQAVALPDGNIGVAYITASAPRNARYAYITPTGSPIISGVGSQTRNQAIGCAVVNGNPCISFADASNNISHINAGSNNLTFSDPVTFSYVAVGT